MGQSVTCTFAHLGLLPLPPSSAVSVSIPHPSCCHLEFTNIFRPLKRNAMKTLVLETESKTLWGSLSRFIPL